MRKIRVLALGIAACAVAVTIVATGALAGQTTVTANMNGDKEVPGPGDPNGRGEATIDLKPRKEKVEFFITHNRIQRPVAGHIHKGDKNTAGPIKVTLFDDPGGARSPVEGTVRNVDKDLLKKIADHPRRYYVNLHNDDFPDGAIRGQLRRQGGSAGGGGGGGGY